MKCWTTVELRQLSQFLRSSSWVLAMFSRSTLSSTLGICSSDWREECISSQEQQLRLFSEPWHFRLSMRRGIWLTPSQTARNTSKFRVDKSEFNSLNTFFLIETATHSTLEHLSPASTSSASSCSCGTRERRRETKPPPKSSEWLTKKLLSADRWLVFFTSHLRCFFVSFVTVDFEIKIKTIW